MPENYLGQRLCQRLLDKLPTAKQAVSIAIESRLRLLAYLDSRSELSSCKMRFVPASTNHGPRFERYTHPRFSNELDDFVALHARIEEMHLENLSLLAATNLLIPDWSWWQRFSRDLPILEAAVLEAIVSIAQNGNNNELARMSRFRKKLAWASTELYHRTSMIDVCSANDPQSGGWHNTDES